MIFHTLNFLNRDMLPPIEDFIHKQDTLLRFVNEEHFLDTQKTKYPDYLEKPSSTLNLVSDSLKVLTSIHYGPYHFYIDCLVRLFRMVESGLDFELIIDVYHNNYHYDSSNRTFSDFLESLCILKDIKYKIINTSSHDSVLVNNFIFLKELPICKDDVYDTSLFLNKAKNPYKKVYLRRERMLNGELVNPHLPAHFRRMFNEIILENFLKSKGFEICAPEDFKTFQEQIEYFANVKTLVSVTSSGLGNLVFLNPGSTVVELGTRMFRDIAQDKDGNMLLEESLHLLYFPLSYIFNHNHVYVPNYDRQAETIVDRIINTKFLYELVSE